MHTAGELVHDAEALTERVRELLVTALCGGSATIAARDGSIPAAPIRCGYRRYARSWRPAGTLIGWTDQSHLWLRPTITTRLVSHLLVAPNEPRYLTVVRLGAAGRPADAWELSWRWLYPDHTEI